MTSRTYAAFLVLLAVLAPLAAEACEDLPREPIAPASAKAFREYREASEGSLENLDRMVAEAAEGEYLLDQWRAVAKGMLAELAGLEKGKHVSSPGLKKWFQSEVEAWQRIDQIGGDLLELHVKMAAVAEEIEKDIQASLGFHKWLTESLGKLNDEVGKYKGKVDQLNKVPDNEIAKKISGYAGDLTGYAGKILEYSKYLNRAVKQARAFKERFFQDKNKVAEHKELLSTLESKAIDPDGTGVYDRHEKEWEETMFRTHARYAKAVEEWKKANVLIDRDKIVALVKEKAPDLLGLKDVKIVKAALGLPYVATYDFDEKLADFCLKLRDRTAQMLATVRGETWARLEEAIYSDEEEFELLKANLQETFEQNEERARTSFEKAIDADEKELTRKEAQLADYQKWDREELRKDIADLERKIQRQRVYWFEEWLAQEDDKAYREFRERSREIEERIRKRRAEQELVD